MFRNTASSIDTFLRSMMQGPEELEYGLRGGGIFFILQVWKATLRRNVAT